MIPLGCDGRNRPGDKLATNPRESAAPGTTPSNLKNRGVGNVITIPMVGGLHHRYTRRAA